MEGYRKMIESRIPKTWTMALKHCRCYKRYVEHVYKITAGRYNDDCMHTRKEKAKLKSDSIKRTFDTTHTINRFKYTLDMDFILLTSPQDVEFWNRIASWVSWFSEKTPYVLSSAEISRKVLFLTDKALLESVCKAHTKTPKNLITVILKEYGYIK